MKRFKFIVGETIGLTIIVTMLFGVAFTLTHIINNIFIGAYIVLWFIGFTGICFKSAEIK